MSAADALDKLMVHVPKGEFTKPGNKNRIRDRQLAPRTLQAGAQPGGFPGRGGPGGRYGAGRGGTGCGVGAKGGLVGRGQREEGDGAARGGAVWPPHGGWVPP